ncbi:hypothetical protein NEFER03_0698 [Nematocida sp. LUAm3]|nr:hypothetical protein NEFER03_0698 [Nematocida sp. LUAm3]KAI5175157.1 hypothetical protein NEFER02_1118 [Nematocida sp. LUAm2]KAI5178171.1 hypothetical protein NEFER01_1349 [Nematocida sp. LUAm1]
MEQVFTEEYHLLKKILYKTKNVFGSSLGYKRLSQSLSASKRLLSSYHAQQPNELLIKRTKSLYILAYIAVSSNVALGHNLGFSISAMSIVASMHAACNSLIISHYVPAHDARNTRSTPRSAPTTCPYTAHSTHSDSSDEIDKIFQ